MSGVLKVHYTAAVFLCAVLFPSIAGAQDITAHTAVEPETVMVGRPAEYIIAFENAAGLPNLMTPRVDGLDFSDNMSSGTFTQIINGRVSREIRATWTFRATREGTFEIPGRTVRISGREVRIPPATVNAVPMDEESRSRAFLQLEVPDGPFYVGQAIPARLGVLVRSDLTIGNIAFPERRGDFFQNSEFDNNPGKTRIRARGRVYDALLWDILITPIKAGPAELVFTQNIVLQIPSDDDPFPGFFSFGRSESESLTLTSNALATEILPLPDSGRTDAFKGAVGKFEVSAEVSTTNLQAGEPMTLTVAVEGEGNFDRIAPPGIPELEDWRIYPPKVDFQPEDERGFSGRKTFEFILIPRNADITALPEFSYSTFDPETATYETTPLGGNPVSVEPAPESDSRGALLGESGEPGAEEPENRVPEAILPIRTNPGSLSQSGPPFESRGFWVGNGVFGLLLASGAWGLLRRKRLREDWRLQRRQTGNRKVRKALQEARQSARAGDAEAFFRAARTALQESIAPLSHESVEARTLVSSDCLRILIDSETPQTTIDACTRLFEHADAHQFAGARPETAALLDHLNDLLRVIPEINRVQK